MIDQPFKYQKLMNVESGNSNSDEKEKAVSFFEFISSSDENNQ